MIQSRIGLILILTFMSFSQLTFSQDEVKYLYQATTEEALEEMKLLVRNDQLKIEEILKEISILEKEGKIILSSLQFAPIKTRLENFHANGSLLSTEKYAESKKYVEMVHYTYVVITDLINEKK